MKKFEFERIDMTLKSKGLNCGAWLYLPKETHRPPVVVMANGFGGQRWMLLPAYAETFAQSGIAVFVFDYRCFNDSEGTPRNYINPRMHLEDWEAAISHVRSLNEVDSRRIGLWGTSFSGGHVIVTAAKDQHISAVISQVPLTDGISTALSYISTPLFSLKALYHGFLDVMISLFSNRRHYVKIISKPGEEFGVICREDSMPGFLKILGPGSSEESFLVHNKCPANIVFTLSLYRPGRHAKNVSCPTLVISAEKDSLFPPDGPLKTAQKMKNATHVGLPMGHFEPYVGEPFEKLVAHMCDFLKLHLGMTQPK